MQSSFNDVKLHFVGSDSDDELTSLFQIKEAIDYAIELDIICVII